MIKALLRAAVLLLLCIAAFLYTNYVPAVEPVDAPKTEFSAARAMAHVRVIAARPHPIGSEEHRRVAAYIEGELRRMGLDPRVQETTALGSRYPVAGRIRNILVRVPGTSGENWAVLLMAHYDGVAAAPAAGDDASGVSVLLETLRALRSSDPLRHDVIALFTDGEEAGLLGAAAFADDHPWARDVAFTMNFEARGTRGPSLMFETGPGNLDAVRVLRRVGGARATSLSTTVYRQLPNDTDLSEIAVLGKPAMNFGFIAGVDRYHTALDDTTHLDSRSVQDHGEAALALTRELAGNLLPRPETSDAVFFDFPPFGLVVYPQRWAPVFALLILVPFGILIARLRRRVPRWGRGVALGFGGAIVSVALAAVIGYLVGGGLRAIHAAIGSGQATWSGLYAAAVALLSLAVAATVHAILRRGADRIALHAGGVALTAVAAIGTSFVAPGVSFVFTWPALFMAIALARWTWTPAFFEASLWIASAVTAFIVLPIVYLMVVVALGLDAVGATVVAVFTAMTAWLAAHAMELWTDRRWVIPAAAGVAALALFAVGASTVRTNASHPVGSSIGYGADANTDSAFIGVQARTPAALAALRDQLPGEPGPRAPAWFGRYFAATRPIEPAQALVPSGVQVVSDSGGPQIRRLLLRVSPAPGVRAISLRVDGGAVRGARVDGKAMNGWRYRYPEGDRWTLEFHAPPPEGFELQLFAYGGRDVTLDVVDHIGGLPPAVVVPTRPDGVVPIQRGDVTLVHQRIAIVRPR